MIPTHINEAIKLIQNHLLDSDLEAIVVSAENVTFHKRRQFNMPTNDEIYAAKKLLSDNPTVWFQEATLTSKYDISLAAVEQLCAQGEAYRRSGGGKVYYMSRSKVEL